MGSVVRNLIQETDQTGETDLDDLLVLGGRRSKVKGAEASVFLKQRTGSDNVKYDGNPDANRQGYLELLSCKVQQIAECRAEIDQARDTGGLADRFLTAKAKQVGKSGRALSRELIL